MIVPEITGGTPRGQPWEVPLFPYAFKWVGLFLMMAGLFFGYLYFLGGRPRWFEVKIFAVISAYMETSYFLVSQTNLLDELGSVLLLSGICMIVLSRERKETPGLNNLRFKALVYAIYTSILLWIVIYMLVYGWVILWILSLFFALYLLIYYAIFRYLKHKVPRMPSPEGLVF